MPLLNEIWLYCNNTKYYNYSTTAVNNIVLHILVYLAYMYLVLTFDCQTSLSIDFRMGGGVPNGPLYSPHPQTYC